MMKAKPNFRQALNVQREKVVIAACMFTGSQTDENRATLVRAVRQFQQASRDYEIVLRSAKSADGGGK